jgi:hypothetical protein
MPDESRVGIKCSAFAAQRFREYATIPCLVRLRAYGD